MHEALAPDARRNLLDGGYVVLLLTLAIAAGYGVLSPGTSRAKAVGREPAAASSPVATVVLAPGHRSSADAHGAKSVESAFRATTKRESPASKSTVARAVPPADAPRPLPEPLRKVEPAPRVPWPQPTVVGHVLDEARQPIAGASVAMIDEREVRTGIDGAFTLEGLKEQTVVVKIPGYEKVTLQPSRGPIEVVLRPFAVKAAYLTYFGFNDRGIRTRVLDLISRTELNAVVIDVKGDRGWVLYRTSVPLALEAGAQGPATIKDFDVMMGELKARGVYTIARIVTFKDNVLASHRPDWAVTDTRTGKPWIDRENLAWMDPFREEVWDYNIALAREAVARGFDEVQFDYVRFPTDGKLGAARYMKPVSKETRLPTIAGFLERARQEIGPTGAFVGADVFGYTAFNENDTDIGQRIEELAPHLDYVCPMVYPSGYHVGIPGYRNPVTNAYEVVKESVRLTRRRSAHTVVRVRPWLQDFRDYAFDRRIFGVTEIRDQIRGADEGGGTGWMLWNPRNDYTGSALRPKGTIAAK